ARPHPARSPTRARHRDAPQHRRRQPGGPGQRCASGAGAGPWSRPAGRPRTEAETAPPSPRTAVSGHAPSLRVPARARSPAGAGDEPRARPRSQVLAERPGPVPPLRPAPGPRPGALEREPERLGGHALRGRDRDLQPPPDLLLRSLPEDRRALREPAPGGAGGRGGPGTLARVP